MLSILDTRLTITWWNKDVWYSHLTWIMSLHYLVKLEMLIGHVLPLSCYRKKLQNLSHRNCGLQIRQIWIQLITMCRTIAREGVQNTCHWPARTETATENRVGQLGLAGLHVCRHRGSHSSVASLIAPEQWCVFCTPSLATFPTCCYQLDSNLANLEAAIQVG